MKAKLVYCLICLWCLALLQACGNSSDQAELSATARSFNIDIVSSQINGLFSVNGQTYDAAQTSSAFYELVSSSSILDSVDLGYFFDQTYAVNVINGQYSLNYYDQFGPQTPLNYSEQITEVNVQADSVVNIDLERIEITPVFTLNGSGFPQSALERAAFYLQSENSDEQIFLGYSNAINNPVGIIPGSYSVFYKYESGSQIPVNEHAMLLDSVKLDQDQTLDIDVKAISLTALFRINGEEFPLSAYEYAIIALTDSRQQDRVELGASYGGLIPGVPIIPGSYQVVYQHREGTLLPQNPLFVFDKQYDLSNANSRIEIDIPSITLDGNFMVNGNPAPVSAYDYARINLRQTGTETEFTIGNTFEQSYSGMVVIPAHYDVLYQRREYLDILPANPNGTIASDLNLATTQQLDVDIRTVHVSAALTLDGAEFPLDAYNYAHILIKNHSQADEIKLSDTLNQGTPVTLIAGHYQLIYQVYERQPDSPIPANRHFVFLDDQLILADRIIQHDITTREIRLDPTLNGQDFPNSAYAYGRLYLASDEHESIPAMDTFQTMAPLRVIDGSYQVYYEIRQGPDSVPANSYAWVGEINTNSTSNY